jgi:hypothetical protein
MVPVPHGFISTSISWHCPYTIYCIFSKIIFHVITPRWTIQWHIKYHGNITCVTLMVMLGLRMTATCMISPCWQELSTPSLSSALSCPAHSTKPTAVVHWVPAGRSGQAALRPACSSVQSRIVTKLAADVSRFVMASCKASSGPWFSKL